MFGQTPFLLFLCPVFVLFPLSRWFHSSLYHTAATTTSSSRGWTRQGLLCLSLPKRLLQNLSLPSHSLHTSQCCSASEPPRQHQGLRCHLPPCCQPRSRNFHEVSPGKAPHVHPRSKAPPQEAFSPTATTFCKRGQAPKCSQLLLGITIINAIFKAHLNKTQPPLAQGEHSTAAAPFHSQVLELYSNAFFQVCEALGLGLLGFPLSFALSSLPQSSPGNTRLLSRAFGCDRGRSAPQTDTVQNRSREHTAASSAGASTGFPTPANPAGKHNQTPRGLNPHSRETRAASWSSARM